MALHCTKANHIHDRHECNKNTVGKDVKCRLFIAYYVIGGSLVYIGGASSKQKTKCTRQLVNSDRVRTNL